MRVRLGVVADIHGNCPALEAVAADLGTRGVDAVVDCGDIVSGPLWPRDTLDLVRRLGWLGVRGNHDRRVGLMPRDALSRTDLFAADDVGQEGRRWLAELPVTASPLPGVLALHARPDDDEAYLLEDVDNGRLRPAPPARVAERLGGIGGAALVLHGHSHQPALLRLANDTVVLNPGSVGCPAYHDPSQPEHLSEAGAPYARFAVLTLDLEDGRPRMASAELIAIDYDRRSAARRAREQDRPDWAHALEHGTMPPQGSP